MRVVAAEDLALLRDGAGRLFITEQAVSKHTNNIFSKLRLPPSGDDNRRVLAVLAYLRASS